MFIDLYLVFGDSIFDTNVLEPSQIGTIGEIFSIFFVKGLNRNVGLNPLTAVFGAVALMWGVGLSAVV